MRNEFSYNKQKKMSIRKFIFLVLNSKIVILIFLSNNYLNDFLYSSNFKKEIYFLQGILFTWLLYKKYLHVWEKKVIEDFSD